MVFLKAENCEEYDKYIRKAFENVKSIYESVNIDSRHKGELEVILSFTDSFKKFTDDIRADYSFGMNTGNKIYLLEEILYPDVLFDNSTFKDRITQDDVQHVINVEYLHEFQEVVLQLSGLFPFSDAHFELFHFGGDLKCVNNYSLSESGDNFHQKIFLTDLKRVDYPCEFHREKVKSCLKVLEERLL